MIKPDGDESIKEALPTFAGWAAQSTINCDKIDALFKATATTYTPTFAASGGGLTLGAGGSATAKYLRMFPGMVIGYFLLNMGGAGFAAGTGVYTLTLPLTVHANLLTFATWVSVGKAIFQDNSAVLTSSVFEVMIDTAGLTLIFRSPDGAAWGNTLPVALAQNDKLSGYFMYPTNVP